MDATLVEDHLFSVTAFRNLNPTCLTSTLTYYAIAEADDRPTLREPRALIGCINLTTGPIYTYTAEVFVYNVYNRVARRCSLGGTTGQDYQMAFEMYFWCGTPSMTAWCRLQTCGVETTSLG